MAEGSGRDKWQGEGTSEAVTPELLVRGEEQMCGRGVCGQSS